MSLRRTIALSLLLSLAGAAGARAAVDGPRIRLAFVPQENVKAPAAAISAAMRESAVAVAVEDGRTVAARDVVGAVEREGAVANVRAGNDLVVYALGVFVQTAGQWGLRVSGGTAGAPGGAAGRVLTVRLSRFFVDESVKPVGSTYSAEVNALFRLTDGRRLLFEGVAAGTARRYGKSENEENYNEVLSDALKETYAKGLSDPGLHRAWTGAWTGKAQPVAAPPRAPAPPPPPPSGGGISPADLLADLKNLRGQGFATDLMVDYVNQRTLATEMTARDLTAWRDAGIPDEVIKAALARSPARLPETSAPPR